MSGKEREGKEVLLMGFGVRQKDGFKCQLYRFPTIHVT